MTNAEIRIMDEFKMQPSEIDGLPFWRFTNLIDYIQEKDKSAENDEDSIGGNHGMNYQKEMKNIQRQMKNVKIPSMPKMNKIK